MRAVSKADLAGLNTKVAPPSSKPVAPEPPAAPAPDTAVADAVVAALKDLPKQLADAIKSIPAPVIAPRPAGTWVIDVVRDSYGNLDKMNAQFHEAKKG